MQGKPGRLSELRKQSLEFRKTKVTRCHRREYVRESFREKESWKSTKRPLTIQQKTDEHLHMRKLPKARKEPCEKIRGNSTWYSHIPETVPIPTSQNSKIHILLGTG